MRKITMTILFTLILLSGSAMAALTISPNGKVVIMDGYDCYFARNISLFDYLNYLEAEALANSFDADPDYNAYATGWSHADTPCMNLLWDHTGEQIAIAFLPNIEYPSSDYFIGRHDIDPQPGEHWYSRVIEEGGVYNKTTLYFGSATDTTSGYWLGSWVAAGTGAPTGGGEVIPEFSSVGIILTVLIVFAGMVVILKKNK